MTGGTAPAPRERGWSLLLISLALFVLVPAIPPLRVVVPVEQVLVLLVPALAACAVVGWWAGGRLTVALLWLAIAVWLLRTPVDGAAGYDLMVRGWAIVLAASFGLVCMLGGRRPFISRALSALAVSFLLALALLVFTPASPRRVERTVAAEFTRRVDDWLGDLGDMKSSSEWRDLARQNPGAVALAEEGERQMRLAPGLSARVFPALLGLESIVTLALAWGLYHRIARVRIGLPLGRLREFRFNDQLVWGLVAGITVLVVPTLAGFRGAGLNLLVFFGALYALRGLGVLAWFLAPSRVVVALLIAVAFFAWPLLGVFSLGLGLGDTWVDWRGRARPTT